MARPEITEAEEWQVRAVLLLSLFVVLALGTAIGAISGYMPFALWQLTLGLSVLVGMFTLVSFIAFWAEKKSGR